MNKDKYKVLVFDLDGTLTPSRQEVCDEMIYTLEGLLHRYKVCILAGGKLSLIRKQLINKLLIENKEIVPNLHIFCTSGTTYYRINKQGEAKKIYQYKLSEDELTSINLAVTTALARFKLNTIKESDKLFENRVSQVTISCLGLDAPLEDKKKWDPDKTKRIKIRDFLKKYLTDFEIIIGGTTSIDITKKGLNKRYGIYKISEYLNVDIKDILYFGNDFDENGNDYPVRGLVDYVCVKNDKDCLKQIQKLSK